MATQLEVFRLVHNAHAAAANLAEDAVVRDRLPNHTRQCYGGSVGKSMNAVALVHSQLPLHSSN